MNLYPAYKESGYDWTGNIPAHWKMVQLKFAAPRKTYQTENVKEFGFQIALENIESKTGKLVGNASFEGLGNIFGKGDVLFNKLRPYLCKVVIAPQDGVAVSELLVLRPREDIDKRYLFYRLLESKFISVVDGSTYGAKMPRANWDFIGDLKIPVPPLTEQQAIADFLDCKTAQIDTLIEKKQRQIILLQEQRTALINHAITKGLNPDTPMKDSGVEWLGEIPSHWEVMKIAYFVSKITNGYVGPTRDILRENGVRYIQSLHIKRNTIDFRKPYYVSQEWSNEHERTILRENDVLVVQTGAMTGEVGIVPKEFDGANCHALIILRVKHELGYGRFLLYTLTSNYGHHSMLSIMTGALHPHLNTTYLRDVYVAVPSKSEQQEIIEYIENKAREIDLTIKKHNDTISLLQEYRTALISEAVTGKIDVREWKTVHE